MQELFDANGLAICNHPHSYSSYRKLISSQRAKIRKDRITEKGKKETSEKDDDKRLVPTVDFIFLGEKEGEEYFSFRRFRRKTRNASRMFGVTSEQVGSEFKTF